ncbi:hypothetical protein ACHAWF_009733, partial [Thalassiosira exigua]
ALEGNAYGAARPISTFTFASPRYICQPHAHLVTFSKHYDSVVLGGWPCRVKPGLVDDGLISPQWYESDLAAASESLPPHARERLKRSTRVWIGNEPPPESASGHILGRFYTVGKKAGGVEIYNYVAFRNGWGPGGLILHEFSHAWHYHHVKDGLDNSLIKNVYQLAMEEGLYDCVRVRGRWTQSCVRAYACQNEWEYFAELSVAFLGGTGRGEHNIRYPFNRAQVRKHDPRAYDMLKQIWGVEDEEEEQKNMLRCVVRSILIILISIDIAIFTNDRVARHYRGETASEHASSSHGGLYGGASGASPSVVHYARNFNTERLLRRKDESQRAKRLARKERKAAERPAPSPAVVLAGPQAPREAGRQARQARLRGPDQGRPHAVQVPLRLQERLRPLGRGDLARAGFVLKAVRGLKRMASYWDAEEEYELGAKRRKRFREMSKKERRRVEEGDGGEDTTGEGGEEATDGATGKKKRRRQKKKGAGKGESPAAATPQAPAYDPDEGDGNGEDGKAAGPEDDALAEPAKKRRRRKEKGKPATLGGEEVPGDDVRDAAATLPVRKGKATESENKASAEPPVEGRSKEKEKRE